MAEYAEMAAPKEFKTLEIDLEKNIMRLNGDDLERCSDLRLRLTPEEVYVEINLFTVFSKERKKGSVTEISYPNEVMDNLQGSSENIKV